MSCQWTGMGFFDHGWTWTYQWQPQPTALQSGWRKGSAQTGNGHSLRVHVQGTTTPGRESQLYSQTSSKYPPYAHQTTTQARVSSPCTHMGHQRGSRPLTQIS